MNCKRCGAAKVLVEGLMEGRSKKTCQKCGFSEVIDTQGRRMLTDDQAQPDQRKSYLTETA